MAVSATQGLGIKGLFAVPSNFATAPVSVSRTSNAGIEGNPNHPKASSDYPQEYFTPGYYVKANSLDLLG